MGNKEPCFELLTYDVLLGGCLVGKGKYQRKENMAVICRTDEYNHWFGIEEKFYFFAAGFEDLELFDTIDHMFCYLKTVGKLCKNQDEFQIARYNSETRLYAELKQSKEGDVYICRSMSSSSTSGSTHKDMEDL